MTTLCTQTCMDVAQWQAYKQRQAHTHKDTYKMCVIHSAQRTHSRNSNWQHVTARLTTLSIIPLSRVLCGLVNLSVSMDSAGKEHIMCSLPHNAERGELKWGLEVHWMGWLSFPPKLCSIMGALKEQTGINLSIWRAVRGRLLSGLPGWAVSLSSSVCDSSSVLSSASHPFYCTLHSPASLSVSICLSKLRLDCIITLLPLSAKELEALKSKKSNCLQASNSPWRLLAWLT